MKFKRVIVSLMLFFMLLATSAPIPTAVGIYPPPPPDPRADVNGDGVVDIFDLVLVGVAFGSRPGDPNWDPRADVNDDGVVDIFDLVIVASAISPFTPLPGPA